MRWWIKLIVMAQLARMFPLLYLLPQHSYYMVRIVCPARRCQAESSIEPSFKQKKARLEGSEALMIHLVELTRYTCIANEPMNTNG